MKKYYITFLILIGFYINTYNSLFGCTNIIVTKGASKDGSLFLAYTNDAEYIYKLEIHKEMSYVKGDSIQFFSQRNNVRGSIPQVGQTNHLIGFHINEYQVAVGETTFTGREELWNHSKFLEYWNLMSLALERAKTAKEAVLVITNLAEKYGYGSEGESFSVIDKNEAWILEMVGTGNGGEGAIWVAMRIPDGMLCAHANKSVIGEFPLNDPQNCLYSKNVISFAINKGYYNPKSGKPFRFNEAYCPATPANLRYCASRVWSIFSRVAPSQNLSIDYNRGITGAESYPLWIKPDKQLSLTDIFALVRDHYEGTEIDMTKGFDAGAFGNPNRWRPLYWDVDSVKCSWERPISTFNTAFSFVAQTRSFLPDEVGGLIWFGVDDTYFSCYVPVYNCATAIHPAFQTGDISKFSWESAWWLFNLVSNYVNLRYDMMTEDVKKIQQKLENSFLLEQPKVESQALQLLKENKKLCVEYLTVYSYKQSETMMKEWKELAEFLFTKYNDGFVKDIKGNPVDVGFPVQYRKDVLKNRPNVALPVWDKNSGVKPEAY